MLERKQHGYHIQRTVFNSIKDIPEDFTVQDAFMLTRKSDKWLTKAQVRRSLTSLTIYYKLVERVSRGIYKIRKNTLDMS